MTATPTGPLSQPPKLLDRVMAACRLRHYSPRTEEAYRQWIVRYIHFHAQRHPLEMGSAEINQFLTHLAVAGHVSASTQNQAFQRLLFLYQKVLVSRPRPHRGGHPRPTTQAPAHCSQPSRGPAHPRPAGRRLSPDRPAPIRRGTAPPRMPATAHQGSGRRQQRDRRPPRQGRQGPPHTVP